VIQQGGCKLLRLFSHLLINNVKKEIYIYIYIYIYTRIFKEDYVIIGLRYIRYIIIIYHFVINHSINYSIIIIKKVDYKVNTLYWVRSSCSILLRRRNSHESSKAVKSGSFDESAIKDDEMSARYALIRDCECRRESCSLQRTHSSQSHLRNCKC